MKKNINRIFVLLFPILVWSSCQIGHELHFFKASGNYYRIKINERSFASKARYLSGYYDEVAVDRYFDEMSQPKEGDAQKADDVSITKEIKDKLTIDSNKKFLMILSTNSDAVSNQISAFADNEQILESIARLANKDKVEESNKYLADISGLYQRNINIVGFGDRHIGTLSDTSNSTQVQNALLIFLLNLKGNVNSVDTSAISHVVFQIQNHK